MKGSMVRIHDSAVFSKLSLIHAWWLRYVLGDKRYLSPNSYVLIHNSVLLEGRCCCSEFRC